MIARGFNGFKEFQGVSKIYKDFHGVPGGFRSSKGFHRVSMVSRGFHGFPVQLLN